MWFPGDDDDGDGHGARVQGSVDMDEPFFVPSGSSNDEDEHLEQGSSGTRGTYGSTPIHRPSTTRPADGARRAPVTGTSPSGSSFSPDLPTTTTTTGGSSSRATASSATSATLSGTRHHHGDRPHPTEIPAFVSMDDLLFGSAQDRRAALRRRQAAQQPHKDDGIDPSTVAKSATPSASLPHAQSTSDDACVSSALAAGGSPIAVPMKRTPPWPRRLDMLRGMTSANVRGVLEPFFLQKEESERRFRHIEQRVLPELFQDDPSGPPDSLGPATAAPSGVRERDRCARLINIRNWSMPSSTEDEASAAAMDVLLPASLVPWSPFQADGVAMTAAFSSTTAATAQSGASPRPQQQQQQIQQPRQLRRHQINGIRFMWSTLVDAPVGQVPTVGSILAHTMGLGKTGQVIVFLHLFMQCFHTAPRGPLERAGTAEGGGPRAGEKRRAANSKEEGGDKDDTDKDAKEEEEGEGSTAAPQRVLIVVPKSTISSWAREFEVWAPFFPPAHRVHPRIVSDRHTQSDRLRLFYEWRARGGVLLVGYESFVRIMEQVEAQSAFDGLGSASSAFGLHRAPRQSGAQGSDAAHPSLSSPLPTQANTRRLAFTRRRDEGDVTYGGREDPFTELVICDEAHRLKSVHLRVVAALRGLHPLRRLLLTGTPLQNHLQEYWSMMDFCLHKYFDRLRFKTFFSDSIESSVSKLATSDEVQLARNKTFTLINEVRHFVQRVDSAPLRRELPALHEYVVVLKLSPMQNRLYVEFLRTMQRHRSETALFLPAVSYAGKITAHPQLFFDIRDDVAGSLSTTGNNNNNNNNNNSTSSSIGKSAKGQKTKSRTRQPAAQSRKRHRSPEVGDNTVETIVSSASDDGRNTDADTTSSGEEEDADEEAQGAVDGVHAPGDWAVLQRSSKYSLSSLYRASVENSKLNRPADFALRLEDGVKLHAAMLIIQEAVRGGEKTLVFSLSTKLLDLFEVLIAQFNVTGVADGSLPHTIHWARLDGSSSSAQRADMIKAFEKPGGPDVFLLSTKAGGVGITLTAATRVVLVDTSFNPADDQQAIGRAYRYGQTKPVFVYRLLCQYTLEYSIFEQKLAKEWLFQTVVDENSVKRDGLSGQGMHLRQIFDLMGRALQSLQAPVKVTPQHMEQTAASIQEDPVLGTLQALMLRAQRYAFFLEHDGNDTYGDKERAYYSEYQAQRPFNVQDSNAQEAYWRSADAQAQRAAQAAAEQAQLAHQSRSLTNLVDQLIRSRVDQDPNLSRLLAAMGVQMDPATGTVQAASRLQEQSQVMPRPPPYAPPAPPTHQQTLDESLAGTAPELSSDDSDVEELAVLMTPSGQTSERAQPSASPNASMRALSRPPLVTNAHRYAQYAPGRSPATAIELDDEDRSLTPSQPS